MYHLLLVWTSCWINRCLSCPWLETLWHTCGVTVLRSIFGSDGPTQIPFKLLGKAPSPTPAGKGPIMRKTYLCHDVIYNAQFTSHSYAPYGLFPGCSRAVLKKNCTCIDRACTGPMRCRTNFTFPCRACRVSMHAFCCIISLRTPYRLRYHKQPLNSPCGDHEGPVRPHMTPLRNFFQIQFL